MTTAVDVLYSGGFEARFCKAPKKGCEGYVEHKAHFDAVTDAVVLGFTESHRKLLDKPTKSLSEVQKATKRYWQQQKGALRNDFGTKLQRREDIAAGVTNPRNVKSIETFASESCVALKKRLEAAELAEFDTVLALEKLEELATVVNKR
tara:strand:- start:29 stop:475 length:447 start_codon:yes stop_codon:yes gene_type:complete